MGKRDRNQLSQLERRTRQLYRRERTNRLILALVVGLGAGGLVTALLVSLDRLLFIRQLPMDLVAALAGGLVLAAVVIWLGLLSPIDPLALLIRADERLGLKEVLSSAYVFRREPALRGRPLVEKVIEQAELISLRLRPAEVVPLRFRRAFLLSLLSLALAAGSYLLPYAGFTGAAAERSQVRAVREYAPELRELARQIRQQGEIPPPVREKLARKVELAAGEFEKGRLTQEEASRRLARLESELKKIAGDYERAQQEKRAALTQELMRKLRQMGEGVPEAGEGQAGGGALDEIRREMAKTLAQAAEGGADPEAIEKLRKKIAALREAVEKSDHLSKEEKERLRGELERAEESLAEAEKARREMEEAARESAKELSEMAESLSQAGLEEQARELQELAKKMERELSQQGALSPETQKELAQMMENLAEQMAKALAQGSLSPDQLQSLSEQMAALGGQMARMDQAAEKLAEAARLGRQAMGRMNQMLGAEGEYGRRLAEQLSQSLRSLQRELAARCAGGSCEGGGRGGKRAGSMPSSKASSSWGIGTTAERQEGSEADPGKANRDERQKTGEIRRTGSVEFTPVYGPESIEHGARDEQLSTERMNPEGEVEVEKILTLPTDEEALSAYYEVVEDAMRREERAMARSEIPPIYRQLIKGYFEELRGEAKGDSGAEEKQGGDEQAEEGEK